MPLLYAPEKPNFSSLEHAKLKSVRTSDTLYQGSAINQPDINAVSSQSMQNRDPWRDNFLRDTQDFDLDSTEVVPAPEKLST